MSIVKVIIQDGQFSVDIPEGITVIFEDHDWPEEPMVHQFVRLKETIKHSINGEFIEEVLIDNPP